MNSISKNEEIYWDENFGQETYHPIALSLEKHPSYRTAGKILISENPCTSLITVHLLIYDCKEIDIVCNFREGIITKNNLLCPIEEVASLSHYDIFICPFSRFNPITGKVYIESPDINEFIEKLSSANVFKNSTQFLALGYEEQSVSEGVEFDHEHSLCRVTGIVTEKKIYTDFPSFAKVVPEVNPELPF